MNQRRERDAFKNVNFSALGEAIVQEAKRLLHEKHLAGEFDPSWQTCLQMAQKIVIPRFVNVKRKGGIRMETEKTSASPRSRSKSLARERAAGGLGART
jgi:hypothetical protein